MTDQELDNLLAKHSQRQEVVTQINRQVMQTVRRDMRLKLVRKWLRLLGLCFGLPVAAVLYIYLLCTYMPDIPTVLRVIVFALPLGTLAAFFGKSLHDFSPAEL